MLFGKYGLGIFSPVFPVIGWLLFRQALSPSKTDYLKAVALAVIGVLADSLSLHLGLISFSESTTALLPLWMLSLWALFAPVIFLLKPLFGTRYWLAALGGAIMGPVSYKSGESFGVLVFASGYGLLIYAAFWALYTPLAIWWIGRKGP